MKDKTNVGFSVQKCVMETCRVGPTKNTIISKHLKQTYIVIQSGYGNKNI